MKNLKIRTKLLVTFMLIILLFIGTVAVATTGLKQNAAKYSQFYNVGYQITNKVMNMRRGLQIIVKDLTFITIEDDASKIEVYMADMQKELDGLQENGNWLFDNFTGDTELLNSFATYITEAVEMQDTVIKTAQTDNEKAQDMLLDEYQPLVEEAVNTLIQISAVAEQNAETDYLNTVSMQDMLEALLLGMAGGALVITLVLSTYLTSAITRPLRELEKSAEKIVGGNFDFSITYQSRDELGKLADAFRNMTVILESVISDASRLLSEMADGNFDVRTNAEDNYVGSFQSLLSSIRKLNRGLSSTLGQINASADQVAAGAGQVSDGAQALSQGATEQASAVEELASTIAGISSQVKDTAENAAVARKQSNTAEDEVETCNKQMQEMMNAMEEITRTSNQIGNIIKTIESIAFQTNILALNASVEASRAGTAGKGFAVVADEVRNLASKSATASNSTSDLIQGAVNAVDKGNRIARDTAESLMKVVGSTKLVSEIVEQIAEAAASQSDSLEQVTEGMNQISSVVHTNSATAEESAATSQELSSQAQMLRNLVGQFKLRRER